MSRSRIPICTNWRLKISASSKFKCTLSANCRSNTFDKSPIATLETAYSIPCLTFVASVPLLSCLALSSAAAKKSLLASSIFFCKSLGYISTSMPLSLRYFKPFPATIGSGSSIPIYTFLIRAFTILSAHPNLGLWREPGAHGSRVAYSVQPVKLSDLCLRSSNVYSA